MALCRSTSAPTGRQGHRATGAGRSFTTTLALLCTVQFMLVLDVAVAAVALVPIQREFDVSAGNLQWVTTAYGVTFGGLLVLGGRLADVLGGRRMLQAGLTTFTVASVACGAAQEPWQLFIGRGAQGVGAAICSAAALAVLLRLFPEGPPRNFALGMWGAVASAGAIAGQVIGGVFTDTLGWRSIFWINLPIGAVLLFLLQLHVPANRRASRQPLDAAGAFLLTTGLALLIFAITGLSEGRASSITMASITVGGLALASFVAVDRRATHPLLPAALVSKRSVVIGNAFAVCLAGTAAVAVYIASLYLQGTLGLTPLQAGLGFAPVTGLILMISTQTRRMLDHFPLRTVMMAGALTAAGGMLHLSLLSYDGSYLTDVLPGLVAVGVGTGLTYAPSFVAATAGVPNALTGAASGLINASLQVGAAVLLASLVAVMSLAGAVDPMVGRSVIAHPTTQVRREA